MNLANFYLLLSFLMMFMIFILHMVSIFLESRKIHHQVLMKAKKQGRSTS